ncbi:MAG: hypothetical protein IPJ21_11615 [Sterolibacteriaceae bacterium]|nr:hypothetical protein [Sterolibacteriaceae bacterium]MBK9084504.1 hypothetical protein [Sterolibacteriaceae bacterium]
MLATIPATRLTVTTDLEEDVRREVRALHEFLVGWFTGTLARGDFEAAFLPRFDPAFVLVAPGGTLLTLADLAASVRRGYASNPGFRIAIRKVRIRRLLDHHILATYEEWQRNALASTPPENARIASVLLRKAEPLQWLHIHETWLPESAASAGPYDF